MAKKTKKRKIRGRYKWRKFCQRVRQILKRTREHGSRYRFRPSKASRLKRRRARNLVIVSDLHCDDAVGLCPRWGVKLDDGGRYTPSKAQRQVYNWWDEFWGEWVPVLCRHEPWAAAINGDIFDGEHHQTKSLITNNEEVADQIGLELCSPIRAKATRLLVTRGSRAHDGPVGEKAERFAKMVEADRDEDGHHARWDVWVEVGKQLVHVAHTIGSNSSEVYESTAVHRELVEAYVEAGRWARRPPNFIVRSHRHRSIDTGIPHAFGEARAIVTPGWQLKTPLMFRNKRMTPPQLGGVIIRQGDYHAYARRVIWTIERPKVVIL